MYRRAPPPEDPVLTVARAAAASTQLLCLDELHVTDVADAMLLGRLLRQVRVLDTGSGCWASAHNPIGAVNRLCMVVAAASSSLGSMHSHPTTNHTVLHVTHPALPKPVLSLQLLAAGVWVVTTSNRPARDLYKGGLSRRYFEPFIDLVDDRWVGMCGWVGGWVWWSQHEGSRHGSEEEPGRGLLK